MTTDNPFRALPSVDRLLADERLRPLGTGDRPVVTEIVRQALETARAAAAGGRPPPPAAPPRPPPPRPPSPPWPTSPAASPTSSSTSRPANVVRASPTWRACSGS